MKKAIAAVAVVCALWLPVPVLAADVTWLVGKWELSYDPDGNQKDWLEFAKNGKVFSISPTGRRVPGEYVVTDTEINTTFTLNGNVIPITYKFTPDKRKLLLYSKRSGSTSEYRKIE